MRLGALLGPIVDAERSRTLAEQTHRLVDSGYSSLWSAQAIGRGFMITDPFIALTVAATVSDTVEIGTAVVQVPLYEPMDLAHRVFSLQQICGNRFIFGVGAGSTPEDFAAFGRSHADRFSAFAECMASLREIFESGGRGASNLSPWAVVSGGPPIFLGSWGQGAERAAREYDGWIASAHYRSVDEVCMAAKRYRAAGGGRAVVSTIQLGKDCDLGELRDKLERFTEAGFADAVVMFLPGGPSPEEVRKLLP